MNYKEINDFIKHARENRELILPMARALATFFTALVDGREAKINEIQAKYAEWEELEKADLLINKEIEKTETARATLDMVGRVVVTIAGGAMKGI